MDWIVIVILGLGLPITGAVIGVSLVIKKYFQMKENPHEFGLSYQEDLRKFFGRLMVLLNLHVTGVVYGVLIIMLLYISSQDVTAPHDQLTTLGIALALAVGTPVLFSNISRGLIQRDGFEALVQNPENFGRVIVQSVVPDVPMVFGLLFAILSLQFSGLMYGEYEITQDQIDGLFNAALVFAALSSGVIISGILINRIDNPFEGRNFSRGVLANAAGLLTPTIGLVYYITKFLEIGLFTGG